MNAQMQLIAKTSPESSFTPIRAGKIQRKQSWKDKTDEDCPKCRKGLLNLQRSFTNNMEETSSVPPVIHEVLNSPGQPLDTETRVFMEPRFGHDFSKVRVHTDSKAEESARAVNALAYTVGKDIVFNTGYYAPRTNEGKQLLAHELTHNVQQQNAVVGEGIRLVEDTYFENAANHIAKTAIVGEIPPIITQSISSQGLMRSVPQKILIRSAKWLSKRYIKTVSKHIAKHARRIAGKTVFKSPKKIKLILEKTVKEAAELAARHPKAPVTQTLEGSGIKITRQYMGIPGKFRWVVVKTFDKEIGTKGEKILRIIIDQSGRIVTAYPVGRLTAIGLGVATIEALEERTAEASTTVRQMAEAEAALEEKEAGLQWEDFIPIIGDIWGGSLNAGEDEELRQIRFIRQVIDDIIKEVEFKESRSLSPNEREEIEEIVRAAITAPLFAEEEESEGEETEEIVSAAVAAPLSAEEEEAEE